LAAFALIAMAACAPQTQQAPPVPAPPPAPPTTDIWTAAGEGNIEQLNAHKHAGTDLNALAPEFSVTALTIAGVSGQLASAEWLLDNGANVNATNGDGSNALSAVAFFGRADIAELLIENGVDTSARNYEGQSAADVAGTDWATTEYIAALIQVPVDRASVESGRARIVEMIGGGSGGGGFEQLAFAIVSGDAAAVKAALGAGADVNARDPNLGSTPLIVAAFLGRIEIAKMLLAAGADMHAMNNDGANALAIAELDWQTTQDIAYALQVPLNNPDAIKKGKAQIADLLRKKM